MKKKFLDYKELQFEMQSGCLNIDSHFPWSPDISLSQDPSLVLIIAVNQDQIMVVSKILMIPLLWKY